ncbi:MAG TPA: MBOAT family O-acyltransferase, partial [Polyangiales bacterium]|nr:MBOAT family O-acyltransferase [Polyangiales bacterium]
EFWNRWHMTLSRWIRDYLFTPLSMAMRSRPALQPLCLVLAMALCGLWHGAAWTFVLWGVWHGVALALQRTLLRGAFAASGGIARVGQWLLTIAIVFAGWLVFRAPSLHDLGNHLHALFTLRGGLRPALIRESGCLVILVISGLALAATWLHTLPLPRFLAGPQVRPWLRPALYATVLVSVITMDREATAFIYFQF